MKNARIAVVDDHDLLALGVLALLDQLPATVVGHARTVEDLLAQHSDVHLVVLDLRLADGSDPVRNVELLRESGAEVLAYTSGEDPDLVRKVARADVIGMISKAEPGQVLLEAVEQALTGAVVASTDWAAALDSDTVEPPVPLSPREREVLEWYASGEKADRVARRLGVSRETVLFHIRNIRTKYAAAARPAHTKVDLYRRAVEDGVLPPG